MKKELTYDEFFKYIKDNGVTEAVTTEDYHNVPAGTRLYFNHRICLSSSNLVIASFNGDVNNLNYNYNYDFYNQWPWGDYKGKFIIEVDEKKHSVEESDHTIVIGSILTRVDNLEETVKSLREEIKNDKTNSKLNI